VSRDDFNEEQEKACKLTKTAATIDMLSFYASAKGQVLAGSEPDSLPTVRLQVMGRRQVMITDKKGLAEFMNKLHGSSYNSAQLGTYFLQMLQSDFDKYLEENKVYCAMIEPGTVLFTPTNSMVAEKIGDDKDAVGLRVCCLPKTHPENEEAALSHLLSNKKGDSPASKMWAFLLAYFENIKP